MQPFEVHDGVLVHIAGENVDTDQIIPSREIKGVARTGLADGLFAGQRYLGDRGRAPDPAFPLNQPRFSDASVLVSGANFGCGSSREHAVWALAEFGIRSLIAPSFGEIFYNNCIRNGVLPINAGEKEVEWLVRHAEQAQGAPMVRIDLPRQRVEIVSEEGATFGFDLDAYAKRLLVGGLDPIGLTLEAHAEISAFHEQDRRQRPWVYINRN